MAVLHPCISNQLPCGPDCSNQATTSLLPLIKVDLHGSYVDEALETVQSGIRNLPEVRGFSMVACMQL